jgi:integrase
MAAHSSPHDVSNLIMAKTKPETLQETIDNIISRVQKVTDATHLQMIDKYPCATPTHKHLIEILRVEPSQLHIIKTIANARNWATSTFCNRLAMLMGMAIDIATQESRLQKVVLKRLWREANHIQEASWQPSPTSIVGPEVITQHLSNITNLPHFRVPIVLTWLLGQRLGDVLMWRRDNIQQARNGLQVLVTEHKTAYQGPFTLTLPHHSLAAKVLGKWLTFSLSTMPVYPFIPSNTLLTHQKARTAVTEIYRHMRAARIAPHDIRGLRRGGLSAMAELPHAQIMSMSRHKTTATLRRYLGAGRLDVHEMQTQATCITQTEAKLRVLRGKGH